MDKHYDDPEYGCCVCGPCTIGYQQHPEFALCAECAEEARVGGWGDPKPIPKPKTWAQVEHDAERYAAREYRPGFGGGYTDIVRHQNT